jgi:hypothetical protein
MRNTTILGKSKFWILWNSMPHYSLFVVHHGQKSDKDMTKIQQYGFTDKAVMKLLKTRNSFSKRYKEECLVKAVNDCECAFLCISIKNHSFVYNIFPLVKIDILACKTISKCESCLENTVYCAIKIKHLKTV